MSIDVDFDGTLAEYSGWNNGELGKPIPVMVERVKKWLTDGKPVRIFTARVSTGRAYSLESHAYADEAFADDQRRKIQAWCLVNIGFILPVVCCKDLHTEEIWDDLAVQVEFNAGIPVVEKVLTQIYKKDAHSAAVVAELCDNVLDKSGAMLGRIRRLAIIYRTVI